MEVELRVGGGLQGRSRLRVVNPDTSQAHPQVTQEGRPQLEVVASQGKTERETASLGDRGGHREEVTSARPQ